MYHIEALVEDSSGGVILEGLLNSIVSTRQVNWRFEVRRHRGIGKLPDNWDQPPAKFASGLLQLLPAKLRVYNRSYNREDRNIIIVALDTDYRDPGSMYRDLVRLREKYAGDLTVVIGIAVEELEAWMLGDRAALLAAYPDIDQRILNRYQQDAVVGTWEVLARAILGERAERLIKAGYPAVGTYKYKMAEAVAPHLVASRNRSPSFQSFYQYLLKCMDELEEGSNPHA